MREKSGIAQVLLPWRAVAGSSFVGRDDRVAALG